MISPELPSEIALLKKSEMKNIPITALFVDIGGILLTNGWDRYSRKQAATDFKLDWGSLQETDFKVR